MLKPGRVTGDWVLTYLEVAADLRLVLVPTWSFAVRLVIVDKISFVQVVIVILILLHLKFDLLRSIDYLKSK